MTELTTELLSRACRIFLALAYPDEGPPVPANRRCFLTLDPNEPLGQVLAVREVCENLFTPEGEMRGLSFRLGSARFPHVKLQVINQPGGLPCVFAVDTHDTLRYPVTSAEADTWTALQIENRRLKERIEKEWDRQGLLTFNGLLRQGLGKQE